MVLCGRASHGPRWTGFADGSTEWPTLTAGSLRRNADTCSDIPAVDVWTQRQRGGASNLCTRAAEDDDQAPISSSPAPGRGQRAVAAARAAYRTGEHPPTAYRYCRIVLEVRYSGTAYWPGVPVGFLVRIPDTGSVDLLTPSTRTPVISDVRPTSINDIRFSSKSNQYGKSTSELAILVTSPPVRQ
eukprot:COSAG02_NODE_921_length_15917_cov_4.428057_5_plen_186_part_00